MRNVSKMVFGLGVLAYLVAISFVGSVTAEIFSDLGNGLCIIAIYLKIGTLQAKSQDAGPMD